MDRDQSLETDAPVIAGAIHWQNGEVMVFDDRGQQIADYQGRYHEVAERILRDAPDDAVFGKGIYRVCVAQVTREDFGNGLTLTQQDAAEIVRADRYGYFESFAARADR